MTIEPTCHCPLHVGASVSIEHREHCAWLQWRAAQLKAKALSKEATQFKDVTNQPIGPTNKDPLQLQRWVPPAGFIWKTNFSSQDGERLAAAARAGRALDKTQHGPISGGCFCGKGRYYMDDPVTHGICINYHVTLIA